MFIKKLSLEINHYDRVCSTNGIRKFNKYKAVLYNNNNNNIFIHTCNNCSEQYIPINNMTRRNIIHVMLNI